MFEALRYLVPQGGSHKGTSPCQLHGCKRSTREAKPYCSEHIENTPYVKRLLEILAGRDKEEVVLTKGRGTIPKDGFFYRETLLLLRAKDFTAKALSRRLDISHDAANRLIVLMAGDGLAKVGKTARGDLTLSGLAPKDLKGIED